MSKRPNPEDIDSIRLRSRQAYLEKRQQSKILELEKQVQEETAEERSNPNLSKRELAEFARNRETLKLATERLNIDEGFGGYAVPDAELSLRKEEVLNKRHKEYKTEHDLWEEEQSAKAKATQASERPQEREQDYELVFDTTQEIKWDSDIQFVDPAKQALQAQLDAATKKAKNIAETQRSLPVFQYKDEIVRAVRDYQVLILSSSTGSGKTTQVPQYLIDANFADKGIIACTQPRRVAAMSVASRVSEERGKRVGGEVGWRVRFDDRSSEATRLLYLTDGMLLRAFLGEPDLASYSVIIIDEAHERSLSTDILLGMLRSVLRHRPDLRLVIMSATMDSQHFSAFYDSAPIMHIPGESHPVDIYYCSNPEANYISAAITTVFQIHASMPEGDILVFLTGQDEIEIMERNIEETSKKLGSRVKELIVCPIYSQMPQDLQQRIFMTTPPGARKVVLATNIAETSLTIDGIVYVIDPGYVKMDVYNSRTNMQQLVITPTSKQSCSQRSGRAGRTQPGKAFRLFTRWSYNEELPTSMPPEIQRTSLHSVVLLLKSLGINDLINFDFLDPPHPDTLIASLTLLYALGAITSEGTLSKIGRQMSEFPMDPMLSKAILAAETYGCVEEVLTIVAMLPEASTLFSAPKDKKMEAEAAKRRFVSKEGGDHLTMLNIFVAWEESGYDPLFAKESYLQQRTLTRARDVRDQLVRLIERTGVTSSSCGPTDHISIRKALCSGFFPNTARLNRKGDSYRTLKNGLDVYIHPSSVCNEPTARPKLLMYFELVLTSREYLRSVCPIEAEWLSECAPHYFKPEEVEKLGLGKKLPKSKGKVGVD